MNTFSYNKLIFALAAFLSNADAQIATCTPKASNYQCCLVRNIWLKAGKTTTLAPTSATGCCKNKTAGGIPGVTCSGNVVEIINWSNQSLTGVVSPEIGELTGLKWL